MATFTDNGTNTPNGSHLEFTYTFPVIQAADVLVALDGKEQATSKYTTSISPAKITFNNTSVDSTVQESTGAPKTGVLVRVYRKTACAAAKAVYASGSSIRAQDLNNNQDQFLYEAQEAQEPPNPLYKDRTRVNFGDSGDFQIFHDGTHTYLKDTTEPGMVYFDVSGLEIREADGSKIVGGFDGTSGGAQLYYDGTKRLETVSGGAKTTGTFEVTGATELEALSVDGDFDINTNRFTVAASSGNTTIAGTLNVTGKTTLTDNLKLEDNDKLVAGTGDDVEIYHDGTDAYVKFIPDTGDLRIRGDSIKLQDNDNGHNYLTATQDGSVELYYDNSKTFETVSSGAKVTGNLEITGSVNLGIASVGSAEIENDAINSQHYAAGSIDLEHMSANSVDSDQYVDGSIDRVHLEADIIDSTKLADNAVNSEHYVDGSIDLAHMSANSVDSDQYVDGSIDRVHLSADIIDSTKIEDNAVTTDHIADAELTTLAGMQSGTASILAGSTALTSTLAELNLLDGMSMVTTIAANATDVQLPSAQAVNERIVTVMQDAGGFVPIADKDSFPETNPDPNDDAGTIVSIADAGGLVVNGSGVSTTGDTITTNATVTINGIDSSLNNTTIAAGKGMLVETTSTLNTYNYHRLTLDEGGVAAAQSAIDDFNARYRIHNGEPSSSLDDGDLVWDTNANKMKVYDATASAWSEVTSTGDFKFLVPVDAGTATAATWDGSDTSFDLKETTNSGSAASISNINQLIVSLNGVIQKPNTGTYSASEEGFYLTDSDTIRFCTAPPSGSVAFILQIGSAVSIPTPGDNTVSTAKIQNLAVDTAQLAADAVEGSKIADDAVGAEHIEVLDSHLQLADSCNIKIGTGNDLQIYHNGTHSYIENSTGQLQTKVDEFRLLNAAGSENMIDASANGAIKLYYDASKKFETNSAGFKVHGHIYADDDDKILLGDSTDLQIYHNADISYIDSQSKQLRIETDQLRLNSDAGEAYVEADANGAVKLYYDATKKFETTSTGATVTGRLLTDGVSMGDSEELLIGTGNDFKLRHDGTDNHIVSSNGDINIQVADTENAIIAKPNGAVELYYDNTKRLATNSSGASFYGNLWANDNDKITLGFSNDLEIYHDSSNSHIHHVGTGDLQIRSDASLEFNTNGTENAIWCDTNGAVKLYYDNSKKFETTSAGATVTGILSATVGVSIPDNENLKFGTSDDFTIHHNSSGDTWYDNRHTGGKTIFRVSDSSALDLTAFDIAANGRLYAKCKSSSTASLTLKKDDTNADSVDYFECRSDSNALKMEVQGDGDVNNANNSYGSTSDLKLKENIVDAGSQWADIKAVKVRNFNFKTDPDKKLLGVVAQEIETVSAGLVSESIDRDPTTGEDLGTKTKSVKYSILYMKAFKALQEAIAKIETLETKVAALEAK